MFPSRGVAARAQRNGSHHHDLMEFRIVNVALTWHIGSDDEPDAADPGSYRPFSLVAALGRSGTMQNGPGRFLLIDDEATSREISLLILEGAGYEIDAANCAADAYRRLSSARYSLVIADWLLPDGDGIYIADRASGLGAATMIVTGHISDLPPGTGSRHHLLMKPFKPAQLLAAVRAIIGEPSQ